MVFRYGAKSDREKLFKWLPAPGISEHGKHDNGLDVNSQMIGKFATKDIQVSTTNSDSITKYTLSDTASGSCKEKAFCNTCGCTLWTIPAAAQGKFHLIRLPLLEGGLNFRPANEIFARNRPTWVSSVEGAGQWEEMRKYSDWFGITSESVRIKYGIGPRLEEVGVIASSTQVTCASIQTRGPETSTFILNQNGDHTVPQALEMQGRNNLEPAAGPPIRHVGNTLETQSRRPPAHPSPAQPQHISPAASSTPGSRRHDSHGQRNVGASVCSNSPSAVDSMTAVVDEGVSTEEFFGKSSAGSFTAQIKKAIDVRLGKSATSSSDNVSTASRSALGVMGPSSAASPDFSYVLPPRRQADHLIELYWFYVDPLYPFLDRKRWTRAYNAIFAGTPMDLNERVFIATLNVILALSTQLVESQSLEQREQSSEAYFQRAQELLPMNPWEAGSLELTWMVIGSAIRMAQGLGLHLPETSANRSDPGERELLRRIWHGCVLMDRTRMVSVTHGRPAMISQRPAKGVPFPASSALDEATGNQAMIKNPEYYSFFVRSVRLYEIIHKTMIAFYGGSHSSRSKEKEAHSSHSSDPDSSDNEDEDLDRVVQLDRCISRWESKLPDHLRWDLLETNKDEISRRQAVILRMSIVNRFLHARILLLRPILSRFCLTQSPLDNKPMDDNLQARVVQQGAMFCVTTAQNMITTLVKHQTPDSTVGLLPAWWYRVYYVYSAATVLIAAKLRPDVFSAVELGRSWGQAISVLKAHEQFGQSARRCVAALHILSSKILQATPRGGSPGHEAASNNRISHRTGEGIQPGVPRNLISNIEAPDLVQQLAEEFETPMPDFNPQDFADFDLDVNDMSWLNDIQGVWELLNE
ncbi:hypothetical protein FSARC_7500 [Fusarium sarcochroum]|uniref:Xylanolytic transcriptional activator regulatory domain-containing protein n=1 Tax=Fusarium sarcochroum TaxID=1208366 RepID=A0A8H4X870_9HYPO|nr:hypothetical protein FSARC_7500 [Fusarium sarcochroum]